MIKYDRVLDKIEKVPDFPKDGILFYDLMPDNKNIKGLSR